MNFIHSEKEIIEHFNHHIATVPSSFISRIGGTDWELACDYFNDPTIIDNDEWYLIALRKAREIQGYFDFSNNKANFKKYLDILVSTYNAADLIMYAGKMEKHVRFYLNGKTGGKFEPRFQPFTWHIGRDKTLINWNGFIQVVTPFLESFKSWGEGKKILIVSPLSKSIEYQYLRKDDLFLNYKYPNFELKTFNTQITYNNDADNTTSLNVSTNNWHDECQRLADGIKNIDFDIALLSCASYSMFLGDHIKNRLGKTAIYFGGSLNLYFNIYGKRFVPLYNQVGLNPNTLIDAFENSDIEKINGGRTYPGECLDAYFGRKDDNKLGEK